MKNIKIASKLSEKFKHVELEDLKIVNMLWTEVYGTVFEVLHKGKPMVLKTIKK